MPSLTSRSETLVIVMAIVQSKITQKFSAPVQFCLIVPDILSRIAVTRQPCGGMVFTEKNLTWVNGELQGFFPF